MILTRGLGYGGSLPVWGFGAYLPAGIQRQVRRIVGTLKSRTSVGVTKQRVAAGTQLVRVASGTLKEVSMTLRVVAPSAPALSARAAASTLGSVRITMTMVKAPAGTVTSRGAVSVVAKRDFVATVKTRTATTTKE